LVFYGDTPLLQPETISTFISRHYRSNSACSLITAVVDDPKGYGRVVRDAKGRVVDIVEEDIASLPQKKLKEINVGAYCFKIAPLKKLISKIRRRGSKREYYLTDIISLFFRANLKISTYQISDLRQVQGVNTPLELMKAAQFLRQITIEKIILKGIIIVDPEHTYISSDAKIGPGTVIYPYSFIESATVIGTDCRIGPFSHLRGGSIIGNGVEIGNYSELVRTKVGDKCKIKHFCYLGDAQLGKKVNVGAGTVIANFDGKKKNRTTIGDSAFIGCDTVLVAPVKIGKKAITGAGAVVTKNKNVPPGATVTGIPAKKIT
jgi:bifunctional UDP-N-acetylglucosamine pyrophosphorylase/glucosamine-1-phosphate N-acetyltransferase